MSSSVEMKDDIAIVRVKKNLLGGPEGEEFRAAINSAIEDGAIGIVIDLKKVKWMNSRGIGSLIWAMSMAKNMGSYVVLAQTQEKVRSLLKLTHLMMVFEDFDNIQAAIDRLREKPSMTGTD